MIANLYDWIVILIRWLHIITAITWIGNSFFFNWMDRRFKRNEAKSNEGHIGDLWMVHGGGFYQVEKMKMGPVVVPPDQILHWFKWEAGMTWISGALLLILVFYWGGSAFLVDDGGSFAVALTVGLTSILGGWFVYDRIWESSLAEKSGVGHGLTIALACLIAWWLCNTMSGRAAYIHMGAVLGTWMVANVWMRIMPRQSKMVEAMETGAQVDPKWSQNAKNRSVHNNYFTLPIIFIMMSNHFPSTYGHRLNWVILILIGIVGASIRHYFNIRHDPKASKLTLAPALLGLIITFAMTVAPSGQNAIERSEAMALFQVDPTRAASIQGTVTTLRDIPPPGTIRLPQECASHGRSVKAQSLIVNDGKVANALVYVSKGLEGKRFAVPQEEVVMDQAGCIYLPHVAAVQTQQQITFVNSDDVLHNVRCAAKENPAFNISMPNKDSRITKSFAKPEVAVPLKCNLHPWMGAYVGVFDHPYFAVSDEMGEFAFGDLPPGNYQVTVWHEKLGTVTQNIEVEPQAKAKLNFEYP